MAGVVNAEPAAVMKKLRNIMIPEMVFKETDINDAVDWLRSASIKYDTDEKQKGINIVLMRHAKTVKKGEEQKEQEQVVPSITMEVRKISLMEALNLVTKLAGMKWRISGSIVKIVPSDYPDEAIEYRVYDVAPGSLDKAKQVLKDIDK